MRSTTSLIDIARFVILFASPETPGPLCNKYTNNLQIFQRSVKEIIDLHTNLEIDYFVTRVYFFPVPRSRDTYNRVRPAIASDF